LKEKVTKSSSTDEDTTHPCTRLDLAIMLLYLQLFILVNMQRA